MRILTWNVNGVRTLPQYNPWGTLKTFDEILDHLEAEIVCFQEMKYSRQTFPKLVALPPSFDSFFSFPIQKNGYSGVAVYTRRSVVVPLKAEEGLSGLVQPRPPLSDEERISTSVSYPAKCLGDGNSTYKELDGEGRALVIDFGLFVLICVYCPNDNAGTMERDQFKVDFDRMLLARVQALIEEGREVMVVGDLNACPEVDDHCEGRDIVNRGRAQGFEGDEGFWTNEYRRRLRDWLVRDEGPGGTMIDIVRKFWPHRKEMYTCWDKKMPARAANYGTRIDFILITLGLVPWVKAADIQPDLLGSDHCPVYVDLFDEITNPDGSITKLSDVLGAKHTSAGPAEPPRIAAKFWSEHRQNLLPAFFGTRPGVAKSDNSSAPSSQAPTLTSPKTETLGMPEVTGLTDPPYTRKSGDTPELSSESPSANVPLPPSTKRRIIAETNIPPPKKMKLSHSSAKQKGKRTGQSTLMGFFSQPKASGSGGSSSTFSLSKGKGKDNSCQSSTPPCHEWETTDVDEDADFQLALKLSRSQDNILSSCNSQGCAPKNTQKQQQQWMKLLAPTKPPLCSRHQEPTQKFTVNKTGLNHGKQFFTCSRPVGPGYDKGFSVEYKCNFFMWLSDARKQMMNNANGVD